VELLANHQAPSSARRRPLASWPWPAPRPQGPNAAIARGRHRGRREEDRRRNSAAISSAAMALRNMSAGCGRRDPQRQTVRWSQAGAGPRRRTRPASTSNPDRSGTRASRRLATRAAAVTGDSNLRTGWKERKLVPPTTMPRFRCLDERTRPGCSDRPRPHRRSRNQAQVDARDDLSATAGRA